MAKSHMKRVSAPKTWQIGRKESKFITRPNPGAHSLRYSMPLSVILRELLKFAKTSKEANQIINFKDVFVDKRRRKDPKMPVGIMDIIEFPQLEEYYRVLMDRKGKLTAVKADKKESTVKLSRIESKTKLTAGKTQINLSDGRNIIVDKDSYHTGDTVQLSLPDQKITEHYRLEKGAFVMIIQGKYAGVLAMADDVSNDKLIIKSSRDRKFEVFKKHVLVVGKEKPALSSIMILAKAQEQ